MNEPKAINCEWQEWPATSPARPSQAPGKSSEPRRESEIQVFDQLEDEEIDRKRNWLRLDPDYRAAIGALGAESGERTV